MTLQTKYARICNEYIAAFVEKHGYSFDYWIAGDIGGIASFCEQYAFNFTDIRYDIDNNVPSGLIFECYDYNVNYNMDKNSHIWINFKNYIGGARHKNC